MKKTLLKGLPSLVDMSVEELLDVLKGINDEPTIDDLSEEICLNWGHLSDRHKLIQDATTLATDVLILENGERNFENEYTLKIKGYGVIPLEEDRCGWLVGGIITPKGIIAYG